MEFLVKIVAKICNYCPFCRYARENPQTIFGRIMHWHGKWCPFWRAWEKVYTKNDKAQNRWNG